jgi:chromatin modification-related protein YNG2
VTAAASIKISPAASPKHRSASPTVLPATAHTQQKSRLSRQVHPPPEYSKSDADEEGGDMEEEENEDETLYCFCQKQSYGDVSVDSYRRKNSFSSHLAFLQMIACDNDDGCPYEWVCFIQHTLRRIVSHRSSFPFQFHLPCVGLKQPPPEKWYCSPACAKNKGLVTTSTTTTTTRKGRKK